MTVDVAVIAVSILATVFGPAGDAVRARRRARSRP